MKPKRPPFEPHSSVMLCDVINFVVFEIEISRTGRFIQVSPLNTIFWMLHWDFVRLRLPLRLDQRRRLFSSLVVSFGSSGRVNGRFWWKESNDIDNNVAIVWVMNLSSPQDCAGKLCAGVKMSETPFRKWPFIKNHLDIFQLSSHKVWARWTRRRSRRK